MAEVPRGSNGAEYVPDPANTAELRAWIMGVQADLEALRTGDKILRRDFVAYLSEVKAELEVLRDDLALIKKVLVAKWGENIGGTQDGGPAG